MDVDRANAQLLVRLPIVHVPRRDSAATRLHRIVELICDEASQDRPGRAAILERLVEVLLAEALRLRLSPPAAPPANSRVHRIREVTYHRAMRWLLHGRTRTRGVKGGQVLHECCPECKEAATFREVEVTTSAGAFFIDVLSSTDRAFQCSECGEVFDLRDTAGAGAVTGSGAAAALPAPTAPRDLLAELERERAKRETLQAARDQRVDDELAELKRRLGK
jgi:hypothetical protein